jgi:hypothetical protein
MDNSALINSIGLLFDIIGAWLIWRYTLSQRLAPMGSAVRALRDAMKDDLAKMDVRVQSRPGLGIGFMIWGFCLQALSGWV